MSLKKLLFILHDRPDYPSGPIVNYTRLLPRFVAEGIDVHLLVIYGKDFPNARMLQQSGVVIYPKRRTYSELLVKWILKKVEEIQPDVFIPDVSVQGCFAGKWVKASGIPVINTHRSDDALNWGKAIYFSDPAYDNVLSGIVFVNNFLKAELIRKIPASNILTEVIPSGVPIPEFVADPRPAGLKIAYSGRIVEKQKQAQAMIHSFLTLAAKYPEISFTIIGDGPERERCMAMISETPYGNKFHFTGRLEGDEYKRMLATQQVIVLLSDYEGTPGAIMDGMSCGLIPICLKYQGIEELIKHGANGFIVTDRQQSFFEVIDALYYDLELRGRMAAAARDHIISHYSIEIAQKKWTAFMEKCKANAGMAEPFKMPEKIILPSFDPMLLEDRRLSQASVISRMKATFKSIIGS
jgi:glycosyltransferase involved in cell wall biosynthesis